jgi:hypothetical protein
MTKEDRNRANVRFDHPARPAIKAKAVGTHQDAALKAITDNMARLKALRLAREAAAPPPPVPALRKARSKSNKSGEKGPALAEWLAGQQSGGRRT